MENIGSIETIEPCLQEGHLRLRVEFSSGQHVVVTSLCLRRFEAFQRHIWKELGGRYYYRPGVILFSPGGGTPLSTVPQVEWLRAISERLGLDNSHCLPHEDPEREYSVSL